MAKLIVRKCEVCDKEFETISGYAYKKVTKDGVFYFCSYKCYNEFLTNKEKQWKQRHLKDFENSRIKEIETIVYEKPKKITELQLWFR